MWARNADGKRIPGTRRDIYVRVQLREFMQFGDGVREHPFGSTDEERPNQSWGTEGTGPFVTHDPGTDRADPMTWTPRTYQRNVPANSIFAEYWQWNFGGAGDCPGYKWFMPTFNRDAQSRESDTKGAGISYRTLETGEVTNRTNPNGLRPYDPDAGNLTNFWEPSDRLDLTTFPTHIEEYKYWNELTSQHSVSTEQRMNIAQQTITSGGVITMAAWLALPDDQKIGDFWVWDTDGWFYWAAPLPAGQATGLLLSSITLNQDTTEEMYYAIFVDSEMATATHWDENFTNRTPSGQALLELISGNEGAAQDVRAIIADTAVGDTFDYNGYTWYVLAKDGDDALIIWNHATAQGFQYNADNEYTRLGVSGLRGALDAWAAARLTPGLRDIILVPLGVEDDIRSNWDDGPQHPNPTGATGLGFTTPGAPAAAAANQSVFILSRSEALWYFGVGEANNPNRVVYMDTDDETPRAWWLRSPGNTEENPTNIISSSGGTSGSPATAGGVGIRPAMWVSTAIN